MKTKGWKKQRLWARVVVITSEGSLTDSKVTPTGIDFPVTPTTTIKDFGDLEEALTNMFEGVKFDIEYHWEELTPATDPDVRAFRHALGRDPDCPFTPGYMYEVTYLPPGARKKNKKFVAQFIGVADRGGVVWDFSGRPEFGTCWITPEQYRSHKEVKAGTKPRGPR